MLIARKDTRGWKPFASKGKGPSVSSGGATVRRSWTRSSLKTQYVFIEIRVGEETYTLVRDRGKGKGSSRGGVVCTWLLGGLFDFVELMGKRGERGHGRTRTGDKKTGGGSGRGP